MKLGELMKAFSLDEQITVIDSLSGDELEYSVRDVPFRLCESEVVEASGSFTVTVRRAKA